MAFALDLSSIASYFQIVVINVLLSGDNIVVIGMAAAALGPQLRSKAIAAGIAVATVIRIVFAVVAVQLLAITGLLLAGGLLLLWVCWKMYEELREPGRAEAAAVEAGDGGAVHSLADTGVGRSRKTLQQAIVQIIVADVSMSLDNVLAVAGAAKQNLPALVFGLVLSVVLMGFGASLIAKLLGRFPWVGWIGLAIVAYVAVTMVYDGADELVGHTLPAIPLLGGSA